MPEHHDLTGVRLTVWSGPQDGAEVPVGGIVSVKLDPRGEDMAMRDPETARLLRAVSVAVADAREGGCAARACIWDATVAAVDGEYREHASPEARRTADGACRAVDPPTVKAGPRPPDPPRLARWLLRLGNALASRKARHGA